MKKDAIIFVHVLFYAPPPTLCVAYPMGVPPSPSPLLPYAALQHKIKSKYKLNLNINYK
jgi:hypothetical protein